MIRYALLPSNCELNCVICKNKADYALKFTRRDEGDIHTFFCKKCFERFKTDFKNNDLKEIILPPLPC